jgi:uncharacterized protein (TIGR02118 family)
MLKVTFCVRRRPDLTREEFDRYWFGQHAPLVRAQSEVLGIKRYVQTVPLADAAAQERLRSSRGAEVTDLDGCAEIWFDSMEAHLAARKTPEGMRAAQLLVEDERRFVDLGRSQLWYGTERPIIER